MKKIVFCACCEVGLPLLKKLLKDSVRIDYIVSFTKEQDDKFSISGYFDYSDIAKEYNIKQYIPKSYNFKDNDDLYFFKENKFDLIIQGGWQRLFPELVLNEISIGAIGVHTSPDLLPKGRGRSPLNWSLILDKKRQFLHMFLIKNGVDDGDIIDYEYFEINHFDDIKTLYYKNSLVTYRLFQKNLTNILDNKIEFKKQKGEPSYFLKRTAEDGKIDWNNMDIDNIYNLIRALTKPYPGAFTYHKNKKVLIWKAQIFDRSLIYPNASYGEVVEKFNNDLIVNCLGGLLLISIYDAELNDGDILE